MKRLLFQTLLFLCLLPFFLLGCSPFESGEPIEIISWNVQNLFDGIDNGSEYPEFDPGSGNWNDALFHDRLENLSSIILNSSSHRGPDILILQEVENKNCVEQLNRYYLNRCGYRFRYCSQSDGTIQTAILSRSPILTVKAHRIKTEPIPTRSYRDIMEIEVKIPTGNLLIFINHWKSRLGGIEQTEHQRIHSASYLNKIINQRQRNQKFKNYGIIICGDLNENYNQFTLWKKEKLTALIQSSKGNIRTDKLLIERLAKEDKGYPLVQASLARPLYLLSQPSEFQNLTDTKDLYFSPWENEVKKGGSYFYKDKWETIDHFILSPNMVLNPNIQTPQFDSFEVIRLPILFTKSGNIKKWITQFRNGYSDHLPIKLKIK